MTDERQRMIVWLDSLSERLRCLIEEGRGTACSDEELAAKLGAFREAAGAEQTEGKQPMPEDLLVHDDDKTALQIKMHLLRALLEMDEDEAAKPVRVLKVVTLLADLSAHTAKIEQALLLVWTAWKQVSKGSQLHDRTTESVGFLPQLRAALLQDEPTRLHSVLYRQQRAAQLCLAFVGASRSATAALAKEIDELIDPSAIGALARAHSPQAGPADCWRYYEREADRLTASDLEKRFSRHLVAAVAELFEDQSLSS